MQEINAFSDIILDNVELVIVGKRQVLELLMVALVCEGHVLLDDVPGVGKNMMARALAIRLGPGTKVLA